MRVKHSEPVKTECPTFACTLPIEDHEDADWHSGAVWHNDDTTGVWWPDHTDGSTT